MMLADRWGRCTTPQPLAAQRAVFRDIVLTRKKREVVRDQLTVQLEMKMLSGDLEPGLRLPSIRNLARILRVSPNTVSAVYQALEADGRITRRRGAGMFVGPAGSDPADPPQDLDRFVHAALKGAVLLGHTGEDIRREVLRWTSAPPPDHIVVFDPVREMAEVLAQELGEQLKVRTDVVMVADFEAGSTPSMDGAIVAALSYQVGSLARFWPREAIEVIGVHMPPPVRKALIELPTDSTVLMVSHSKTILEFARALLRSLRGDDILFEACKVQAEDEWRPLLRVADLVLTEALSIEPVKRAGHRRVIEAPIVTQVTLDRLRALLSFPKNPPTIVSSIRRS